MVTGRPLLTPWGPAGLHFSQSSDLNTLTGYSPVFSQGSSQNSRNLPKWNFSAKLNELATAPFEPMKDKDLKHLFPQTAFLLDLASGKRRREIHAWVANKVSDLGQMEKVTLFPSSDFIAKNHLARSGIQVCLQ